jgi:hypothetical protein
MEGVMARRYTEAEIYHLISDPEGFIKLHPEKNRNQALTLRRYYIKQLNEGKIEMPKPPSRDKPTPENAQGRLTKTWEVARGNEDDQWDIVTLHAFDHSTELEDYEPIEPAKIRPSRAKRIERASRFILVYGDSQVDFRRIIDPVTDESRLLPLHDEAMLRVIQRFNSRYRPETTVNLGDFADMAALSKFTADSDHFHKTLGPSLRTIHDFYAQLVADNPDARHVEVDSNHAVRPKKRILERLPALHDLVLPGDDYPLLTYYRLANLGRLGIEFVSGYGAAEFVYGEGDGIPIVFKHGTHSSSVPGSTVKKEAVENPEVHIVRGHGHSDEHVSMTDRSGRRHFYYMLGSSCINGGPVPGYHSAVDDRNQPVAYHNRRHQNTFSLIEDFGNGDYQVDIINVNKGVAHYRGEVFDGNKE